MERLLTSFLFVFLTVPLFLTAPQTVHFANAQTPDPKILLHAQPPVAKNPCSNGPTDVNCQTGGIAPPLTVNWPADGTPAYVYTLLVNVPLEQDGIRAAAFGIEYQNSVVSLWNACGNAWVPGNDWPESGGGVVVSSVDCRNDSSNGYRNAVLGFFYVASYADDLFQITPRNYHPFNELAYGNCSGQSFPMDPLQGTGAIGFGSTLGNIPCLPVEQGTWGGVKKLFVASK